MPPRGQTVRRCLERRDEHSCPPRGTTASHGSRRRTVLGVFTQECRRRPEPRDRPDHQRDQAPIGPCVLRLVDSGAGVSISRTSVLRLERSRERNLVSRRFRRDALDLLSVQDREWIPSPRSSSSTNSWRLGSNGGGRSRRVRAQTSAGPDPHRTGRDSRSRSAPPPPTRAALPPAAKPDAMLVHRQLPFALADSIDPPALKNASLRDRTTKLQDSFGFGIVFRRSKSL